MSKKPSTTHDSDIELSMTCALCTAAIFPEERSVVYRDQVGKLCDAHSWCSNRFISHFPIDEFHARWDRGPID
jgi:hypothetical protein